MTFLLTLGLTFVVVFAALLFFMVKGPPVYRLERVNIIRLLELVVSGEAEPRDWEVFLVSPTAHDESLADIQLRCMEIGEREYLGQRGRLFTRKGTAELAELLAVLKAAETGG